MSRETGSVSEHAAKLLQEIQKKGQGGNFAFKKTLGFTDEQYAQAKEELLSMSLVAKYQAYGGGLRPTSQQAPVGPDDKALEKSLEAAKQREKKIERDLLEEQDEKGLYPVVERWAIEVAGYTHVAITAERGPIRDKWENPDLIAVNEIGLLWHVGSHLEVTAIEVKLIFNLPAIWQAAHYRRFSQYVYLACYEKPDEIRGRNDGRLYGVATDLGLGLISIDKSGYAGKGFRCMEINSPTRQSPRVDEVDKLLEDYKGRLKLMTPGERIFEQQDPKRSRG